MQKLYYSTATLSITRAVFKLPEENCKILAAATSEPYVKLCTAAASVYDLEVHQQKEENCTLWKTIQTVRTSSSWLDLTVVVLHMGDEWDWGRKGIKKMALDICWYSEKNVLSAPSRAEWTQANLWYVLADNVNCLSDSNAKKCNISFSLTATNWATMGGGGEVRTGSGQTSVAFWQPNQIL